MVDLYLTYCCSLYLRMHAPMLAVGSNDSNPSAGGKVQIHEYDEANR